MKLSQAQKQNLWKLLIDQNMNKTELQILSDIIRSVLMKLGKNEDIST